MDNKNFASSNGVSILSEDQANPADGMVNYITSSYQTGYQNGDIKGAFLSDTDDTDLVGGELVTNGDFATNDLTGWTDESVGTGTVDASTGAAEITATDPSNEGRLSQSFSAVVGKTYVVSFTISGKTAYVDGNFIGLANYTVGTYNITVVADATNEKLRFRPAGSSGTVTIDNVSVKLADADRSVNNNGLIVNGTVNREPVAPGADLVAYSGSNSGYLEQPYNPDLDFGTGDFCVMGWGLLSNSNVWRFIFDRTTETLSGNRLTLLVKTGGNIAGQINNVSVASGGTGSFPLGVWNNVVFLRRNGTAELWLNGNLLSAGSTSLDISNNQAISRIGTEADGGNFWDGSLALLRISATAPTAEQIKKIYEDEKFLFQENSQATLYGTSDAVTALAHDEVTDLLHVGTSDGRSVFQGLRRVENTTDPVNTAISAHNGLIAEE